MNKGDMCCNFNSETGKCKHKNGECNDKGSYLICKVNGYPTRKLTGNEVIQKINSKKGRID